MNPFEPVCTPPAADPSLRVTIGLTPVMEKAAFARYAPFGDGRQISVSYRTEPVVMPDPWTKAHRRVVVSGQEWDVVTHEAQILGAPRSPGDPAAPAEPGGWHPPVDDVLYLPGLSVRIPRHPKGFTDGEVETILAAIRVEKMERPEA